MTGQPVSRRECVRKFAAFCAAFLPISRVFADRDRQSEMRRRIHALRGLLGNPQSAEVVGREYRGAAGREAEFELLSGWLERALPEARETSRHTLRAWLSETIRQDFDCGDTVQVAGWVLSVTEARLCAVIALVSS